MNKPLVKYVCEIGGIDFYSVPDHARVLVWGEPPAPSHYAPNEEIRRTPIVFLDIWCIGNGAHDKMYPPFKIKSIGGKVLIDSETGEDVIKARAGKEHNNRLFVSVPVHVTLEQFAKIRALEETGK